nr:MGC52864 protein [Xenopus laevis]
MKIFVGNVDDRTTQEEITELFERYGTVVNCAVMKQYAFVHMRGAEEATKAVEDLNGRELNGKKMLVELSKPRPQNTWKIFVGNVSSSCEGSEIRKIFEEYGRVVECDIVKDYAFVHMTRESEARAAIEALNGKEIKGKRINVEMSHKVQRSGTSNGSSHGRRRTDDREAPQSRESYNHRRATEAAYASYALKSGYERYAPESSRYDLYESRPRPPSPLYYARDRSPMRRSDYALSQTAALASKYRSELAGYGNLASGYSGQASALASYANQASALASSYSSQRAYSGSSGYGTDQMGSYSTQPSAYSNQGSSIYGTQSASLASSYGSQPSHMSASPYASSVVPSAYRQQQAAAYDTTALASLGQQSMTSTNPMYERTRLSPPRTSIADSYKSSADIQRYATDRRFTDLSDYRRISELSAAYRQSPPSSALDYRRPESQSDYALNDFFRSAQLHAGYPRRL